MDNSKERIHHAYWELTMLFFLNVDKLAGEINIYEATKKNSGVLNLEIREALFQATNSLNLLAKELNVNVEITLS